MNTFDSPLASNQATSDVSAGFVTIVAVGIMTLSSSVKIAIIHSLLLGCLLFVVSRERAPRYCSEEQKIGRKLYNFLGIISRWGMIEM